MPDLGAQRQGDLSGAKNSRFQSVQPLLPRPLAAFGYQNRPPNESISNGGFGVLRNFRRTGWYVPNLFSRDRRLFGRPLDRLATLSCARVFRVVPHKRPILRGE